MRNKFNLYWSGVLTLENLDEVAGLFRQLLDGKRYTFVSAYEYRGWRPEVRMHQQVEPHNATDGQGISLWREDAATPTYGGFHVVDTYGVWGLSCSVHEKPYVSFEYNKVTMELKTPAGKGAWWVVAVEGEGEGE
jgi:hypothetical protein